MATGPKVIAFAAPSGSGKTTLMTQVIERLKAQGLRVGAIKSDAHRVELDKPGKDTHRMRDAGADTTALVSRDQIAVFRDAPGREIPLAEIVRIFFSEMDYVLAEGFRSQGVPTIVIRREGIDMAGWDWPTNVVAVATDGAHAGHPVLDLNDADAVAAFVRKLPDPEG